MLSLSSLGVFSFHSDHHNSKSLSSFLSLSAPFPSSLKHHSSPKPMASSADDWSLDQPTREATVARLSANLVSMAFARGAALDVAAALEKSKTAERRAYTTAQVESRTTTGVRPYAETLRAYAR